jgi:hypothetical protein
MGPLRPFAHYKREGLLIFASSFDPSFKDRHHGIVKILDGSETVRTLEI